MNYGYLLKEVFVKEENVYKKAMKQAMDSL